MLKERTKLFNQRKNLPIQIDHAVGPKIIIRFGLSTGWRWMEMELCRRRESPEGFGFFDVEIGRLLSCMEPVNSREAHMGDYNGTQRAHVALAELPRRSLCKWILPAGYGFGFGCSAWSLGCIKS
ncbi:hypothetical protein ACH5RR_011105 [Cinchona calisaya]|uniref:Uncharacterized protein n=1 Tax=Cinchona calisaya TaxID=153742 RepID=A0ABD3A409_9GENT